MSPQSAFWLLPAAWALLSFRGGLHAWQQALAALMLLAALARMPLPRLNLAERRTGVGVGLLLVLGVLWARLPQAHMNAVAGVGALWAVFALARRSPAWGPSRAAVWMAVLGLAAAAIFLGYGWLARGAYEGRELSGPMVKPHLAARWFAPNQNLLAGGLVVPALLVCWAWGLAGRRWAWAGVLLAGTAVVYAGSRGAYVALAGGLGWAILRSGFSRQAMTAALGLVLLVAGLAWRAPFSHLAKRVAEQSQEATRDQNFTRRSDFWKGALRLGLEAPWTGQGLGSFPQAAQRLDLPTPLDERTPIARYRLRLEHAHNEWLNLAVELGWPLAGCLGMGVCVWAWRRWRAPGRPKPEVIGLEAGLASAAVLACFDMNLRVPGLLWGYAMSLAALAPWRDQGSSPNRWPWVLGGVFLALLAVGKMAKVQARPPRDQGLALLAARLLQPLDAGVHARAWRSVPMRRIWAGEAWAGRHDSEWQLAYAYAQSSQGDLESTLVAMRRVVELRPYWAPGWFMLAEHQARAGNAEGEAASVHRALQLEPNFARAWAWVCDRALVRGDSKKAREALRKIHDIQHLKVLDEAMDPYTKFIQEIPEAWFEQRNKTLGLSTVSKP